MNATPDIALRLGRSFGGEETLAEDEAQLHLPKKGSAARVDGRLFARLPSRCILWGRRSQYGKT